MLYFPHRDLKKAFPVILDCREGSMGLADLTPFMVIVVIIGVFFASFMDAIAGGGGIISLPAYLLSGLPMHTALGTNKLSAGIGTAVSSWRYAKNGCVDWKLVPSSAACALIGSHLGTRLQLIMPEEVLQFMLLPVLPLVAFIVLRERSLPEEAREMPLRRRLFIVSAAALLIGAYDGFYGPGTGTFLLLLFCHLAGMDVRTAGGNVKIVNLSSNIGALVTSLAGGRVFLILGLIGSVSSIAGHWLGSGMAIKNGSKIVRPVILIVLLLLAVKIFWDLFGG